MRTVSISIIVTAPDGSVTTGAAHFTGRGPGVLEALVDALENADRQGLQVPLDASAGYDSPAELVAGLALEILQRNLTKLRAERAPEKAPGVGGRS